MSSARDRRPAWLLFAALAAGIVVADQLTKAWLTSVLPTPNQSMSVVDDLLRLVFSQNRGGLFGLLQGSAIAFAGVSLLVIAGIVAYHATSSRDPWLSLALGLLLGGAIGNLIDRVIYGRVTDFIVWHVKDHEWPAFNIADAALCIGVALMVLDMLKPRPAAATPA